MTILWDLDPAAADTYRFALGGEPTRLDAGPRVSRALEEDPSHTLVVIGADIPLEAACQLAEGVRVQRPELGVILLRHRLEVTALAQALRSGVREVVQADDLPALADAVRRSSALTMALAGHHPSVAGREGKIVTVFSAKGASARRPCRPTSRHTSPRPAPGPCSSTWTSCSATSPSACSCSRRTRCATSSP